jgi:hypothetical protein
MDIFQYRKDLIGECSAYEKRCLGVQNAESNGQLDKMLELILTQPREREHLIKAACGPKYLVLDELRTNRGRRGADVSMLVRLIQETLKAENVVCIGTSSTMGTGAALANVKLEAAGEVSRLSWPPASPEHVTGERFRRITSDVAVDDPNANGKLGTGVMDPKMSRQDGVISAAIGGLQNTDSLSLLCATWSRS